MRDLQWLDTAAGRSFQPGFRNKQLPRHTTCLYDATKHGGTWLICRGTSSTGNLRNHPGFTAVAALSLALGIGANTAVFSLVGTLLVRQLRVERPEQLVLLGEHRHGGDSGQI
jgi:hypothetical protein